MTKKIHLYNPFRTRTPCGAPVPPGLSPQWAFRKDLIAMAKEASNGDTNAASKPPPSPSPLRNSKFFQSPKNFLSKGAINKSFEDRKRQLKHECSGNEIEDGHSSDIKRQKKLNYGSSDFIPSVVSHSEISVAPNSELELESRVPLVAPQQAVSNKSICAFCQSSKVSEVSLAYEDGHPVDVKGVGRKVIDRVQETYDTELVGKDFAYDGEKSLFTVGPLPRNKLEFTVVLEDVISNS